MSATTSSDAIGRQFAQLAAAHRRALVVYVTAGHPNPEQSVELIRRLPEHGADIIEVGVPFSDPIADGPIIQSSSQRALEQGVGFEQSLSLLARAAPAAPVVLFTYLNPLLTAGPGALERAAAAGASGVLVTDLPLGADPPLEDWIASGPLAFVRLVAPTTPPVRMAEIARCGSGFVYLISRRGVTGLRKDIPSGLDATVRALRASTRLPVCVGFGISGAQQAAAVARLADGVVVGSAIVKAAGNGVRGALLLVEALRAAIDAA